MKNSKIVYICHTFYHVYISVLKELAWQQALTNKEDAPRADIVLSTMSNDFGSLRERLCASGIFREVFIFDEKADTSLPEVMRYKKDRGNIVLNMLQRIIYTKKLGRAQEKYVPEGIKSRQYDDIYVYCDSDPIGYYLNYKKIYYHSVEDGLDTIKYCDDSRYNNQGNFGLKVWMAKHNLIFIENGYSKYCIDFEVNDTEGLFPQDNYVEVKRSLLEKNISNENVHYLIDIFFDGGRELLEEMDKLEKDPRERVMILSDPVCDPVTRKKIMRDITSEYGNNRICIIKPHPRDLVDYDTVEFSDCHIIRGKFPMEIMNHIPQLHVNLVISILTVVDNIGFADKAIKLGPDFMDKYEDSEIHRQNEHIKL